MKNGDGRGAMGEYIRAADLLPKDAKAQVKAGSCCCWRGRSRMRRRRAEKALAIDPKNVEALILLGNALAGLKDLDGAIAEYQEALALNPAQEAAYANIGAIQFSKGQNAEAEATFKKAVAMSPKSSRRDWRSRSFYWATERRPEAEQDFKGALALDPENLHAHRALGVFYMSTGRTDLAEPHFKAIAKTANTPGTHHRAGRLLPVREEVRPGEADSQGPCAEARWLFGGHRSPGRH